MSDGSEVKTVRAEHVPRPSKRVEKARLRSKCVETSGTDRSCEENVNENRCDEDNDEPALWPLGDPKYRIVVTDGSQVLKTSLNRECCSE